MLSDGGGMLICIPHWQILQVGHIRANSYGWKSDQWLRDWKYINEKVRDKFKYLGIIVDTRLKYKFHLKIITRGRKAGATRTGQLRVVHLWVQKVYRRWGKASLDENREKYKREPRLTSNCIRNQQVNTRESVSWLTVRLPERQYVAIKRNRWLSEKVGMDWWR